jgi:hypothetical protein
LIHAPFAIGPGVLADPVVDLRIIASAMIRIAMVEPSLLRGPVTSTKSRTNAPRFRQA